jgi:uncharacterized protein (DUF1499 family)
MMKITGTFLLCMCMTCCSGTKTLSQGIKEGMLTPCPDTPNCVSSQAEDEKHHMDPIPYTGTVDEARQRLLKVIASMKRAEVMADQGNYLHVVFTSMVFRFRDDVEFAFDDEKKVINFRSASRVGYSDLGVNRKRMEEITKKYVSGE